MALEEFVVSKFELPSGRNAELRPSSLGLVLESGQVVVVTGTQPLGTVLLEMPSLGEVIDIGIDIWDKITGDGGGDGGGGGDKVTVTVEGGKGKKVTIIVE